MQKIWVTGSKGQLGREIFLQKDKLGDCRFLFTDIEELDLTDKDAVVKFAKAENPDWIINCAAYTAVDKAEEEPELAFAINRDIPANLSEAAKLVDATLIHISTDYVFDGSSKKPYTEEDLPNPVSVYAESKYSGEQEALKNSRNIVIRTSWLYSSHGKNFLKTMLRLGGEKEQIGVVSDQFGSPTSAADLAGALLQIISFAETHPGSNGGIYHYANEGSCNWFEFATAIMEIAGLNCKVNPIPTSQYPTPARRPVNSIMSKEKIKAVFGLWIPDWKKSLREVLEGLN